MEKLKQGLRKWLGLETTVHVGAAMVLEAYVKDQFSPGMEELRQRIADLEDAYPDYNKAKEKAEADQKNEVVPGFRPFSQRKRGWENAHRKTADKKEQSGSV
jgi:hypothetical protein